MYRYPGEAFVAGSQLIVGEGQVAVFVNGGQALDYFTAGTYTFICIKSTDIARNNKYSTDYFKGVLVMKVKSLISKAIIKNQILALEISAFIDEISDFCKAGIS